MMTEPPSDRPAVPEIDAATRRELTALIASARTSARTSRGARIGATITVGAGALALSAAAIVTHGFSLSTSPAGEPIWTGQVPSGATCSSLVVLADSPALGVTSAQVQPYRDALAAVADKGLDIDDQLEFVTSSDYAGPYAGAISGEDVLEAVSEGSYVAVQRDDGSGIYDLLARRASTPEPTLSAGVDDTNAADTGTSTNSGLEWPDGFPMFYTYAEEGDGYIARPATDGELAHFAEDAFGDGALTRGDLVYLGTAEMAISMAFEDELASRGLKGIVLEGDRGSYDPVTSDGWSCE